MNKKTVVDAPGNPGGGKRRILVVDASRVVRVTLAKRLGDCFDVVEEGNGESAWQRLMLDGSIVAVISGLQPPRLSARDLMARARASALRRLSETPFVLLVSDLGSQADPDKRDGIVGFMTKSMSQAAMVACLEDVLAQRGSGARQEDSSRGDIAERPLPTSPATKPSLPGVKELTATIASHGLAAAPEHPVCVLVFDIDHLEALTARFGADISEMLTSRIARMLAAKIDAGDQLGLCADNRLAIVSRDVDLRQGLRFARRVCKSLAAGQIAIHGQKVRLTLSVGVASTSDDKAASAAELIALAEQRLEQALVCGGNTVCTEHRPDCPLHCQDKSLVALLGLLRAGDADLPAEQKDLLSREILPALHALNAKLALDLPLHDIERRLGGQTGISVGAA